MLAGAAGLAGGLGHAYPTAGPVPAEPLPHTGRAAVLAGSCSARALEQIAHFRTAGLPALHLDVLAAAAGHDVMGKALAWCDAQSPDLPVLLHASTSPEELAAVQGRLGVTEAAARVEELLARSPPTSSTAAYDVCWSRAAKPPEPSPRRWASARSRSARRPIPACPGPTPPPSTVTSP